MVARMSYKEVLVHSLPYQSSMLRSGGTFTVPITSQQFTMRDLS